MKNINKKTLIFSIIGILLCVTLVGTIRYNIHRKNKTIAEFNIYLDNYKQETSTYDMTDKKENYENLIKQGEQAITNKDYKSVQNLKTNLDNLKQELLESNLAISNKSISELEAIDISTLSDKDSILSKIDEIKTLRDGNKFIEANQDSSKLKEDINKKLETLKQEEEKKKVEAEAKRIEEEKKKAEINSDFTYKKAYDFFCKVQNRQLFEDNGKYFINKGKTLEIGANKELYTDKETELKYYYILVVDKVAQANGAANGIVERAHVYENGGVTLNINDTYNNNLKNNNIAF